MKNIPFSAYDFFAYLSSGLVLLATIDVVYGAEWLLQEKQSLALGFVGVFVAYVAGHAIAQLSSVILENWILGRGLGRPHTLLMSCRSSWWRYVFPNYFKALPAKTQERVRANLLKRNFEGEGEALFLHVFSAVKSRAGVGERLQTFLNLYGFARNVCLALVLSGVMLLAGPIDDRSLPANGYGIAMLAIAIVTFYRYLKFFRQYSYEIFVSYSEVTDKEI